MSARARWSLGQGIVTAICAWIVRAVLNASGVARAADWEILAFGVSMGVVFTLFAYFWDWPRRERRRGSDADP